MAFVAGVTSGSSGVSYQQHQRKIKRRPSKNDALSAHGVSANAWRKGNIGVIAGEKRRNKHSNSA